MNIFRILLLYSILNLSALHLSAQKQANFTEGVVTYTLQIEGLSSSAELLNGTEVRISFHDNRFNITAELFNGFASVGFISDAPNQLMAALIDIPELYEKVAIRLSNDLGQIDLNTLLQQLDEKEAPLKNQAPQTLTPESEVKWRHYKRDKARYAKQSCTRMQAEFEGQSFLTMYVAKRLRFLDEGAPLSTELGNIQGFPLYIELHNKSEGVSLSLTATNIEHKSPEANIFELPEGYTEKSIEEFWEETLEDDESGIGL